MKFPIALIGLLATHVLSTPLEAVKVDKATIKECGVLGVQQWDRKQLTKAESLANGAKIRLCNEHPAEHGIKSPTYDPNVKPEDLDSSIGKEDVGTSPVEKTGLEKRYPCYSGGRGHGNDYDYGCDNGWCWRNCDVNFLEPGGLFGTTKPWCWLAGGGGWGAWSTCTVWQDCKNLYDYHDAKCGNGPVNSCKACGCSC